MASRLMGQGFCGHGGTQGFNFGVRIEEGTAHVIDREHMQIDIVIVGL